MTANMQIAIRQASLEDIESLADIERAAALLFPPGKLPEPDKTTPLPVLFKAFQENLLFIASQDETPCGFASCHQFDNFLHLDEISVHPDYGEQGIGSRLLARVVEETKRRALKACSLTTFEDIAWNAPFYAKRGFKILPANEAPDSIQAILDEEKSLGLSKRIAMYRPV